MSKQFEQRMVANLAKMMAMLCVRNTRLEDLHAGRVPVSRTGDFSDVRVIDADGNEIPWTEVSHLDDAKMKALMKQIVNRLYTFHLKSDDNNFQRMLDRWAPVAGRWDEPEIDEFYKQKSHD
ncbi:MAG: hypothetical protein HQL64_09680 [Magnetococcales bacterium]|nr:hypothetical protein [Magnetococcales bacterium]